MILLKSKQVKAWWCMPAISMWGKKFSHSRPQRSCSATQQLPVSKTLRARACNSTGKHLPSMHKALDLSLSTENRKTHWLTVPGTLSICYKLDSLHNKFLQHRWGGSKPEMEMIPSDVESIVAGWEPRMKSLNYWLSFLAKLRPEAQQSITQRTDHVLPGVRWKMQLLLGSFIPKQNTFMTWICFPIQLPEKDQSEGG